MRASTFPTAVEGVSRVEYPKLELWMPSYDKSVVAPFMRDGAPGAAVAAGGEEDFVLVLVPQPPPS